MKHWRALAGTVAWCAVAAQFALGRGPMGLVELLFLLAPLVAVPLGMMLAQPRVAAGVPARLLHFAVVCQPYGALLVVASFWLEPGRNAAILAGAWAAVCCVAGLAGLLHLVAGGWRKLEDTCLALGLLSLSVGGGWLVLSRAGIAPLGFVEPIVLLTAVHFHFAGFATALIFGATAASVRATAPRLLRAMRFAATGVLLGPGLIAVGFVLSLPFKIFAVFWFSLSVWGVALLNLILQRHERGRARVFLIVSSASVILGMMLAALWVVEEWTGRVWVDLANMARTHGVLNGPGFALCGLLGWVLSKPAALVRR